MNHAEPNREKDQPIERDKYLNNDEVKQLRIELEISQKKATELLHQNQEIYRQEIADLKAKNHELKDEIQTYRHALQERNDQLCMLEIEMENRKSNSLRKHKKAAIGKRSGKKNGQLEQEVEVLKQEVEKLTEQVNLKMRQINHLQPIFQEQKRTIVTLRRQLGPKIELVKKQQAQLQKYKQLLIKLKTSKQTSEAEAYSQTILAMAIQQLLPAIDQDQDKHKELIHLTALSAELHTGKTPEPDPFFPNEFFDQLEQQLIKKTKEKGIYFARSGTELPTEAICSRWKIEAIFNVLTEQIIEHIEKGRMGIHITCSTAEEHLFHFETIIAYTSTNDEWLFPAFSNDEELPNEIGDISLALLNVYAKQLGGRIRVLPKRNGLTTLAVHVNAQAAPTS